MSVQERVKGTSKVCGVIGCPVEHSLSPQIHNTLAELRGDDIIYVAFPVKQDIKEAVRGLYAAGVEGINITVPYKKDVMPVLTGIDAEAEKIGAVNTLKRTDKGYFGYNTDAPGLKRALSRDGIELKDRDVVLLGAGGAARAAAFLAAREGAGTLLIANRTMGHAKELADAVSGFYPLLKIEAVPIEGAAAAMHTDSVVIQSTSAGLYPKIDESPLDPAVSDMFYAKSGYCFDLIYRPEKTRFLREAEQRGIRTSNGLAMLVCQGVSSYEHWFDAEVSEEHTERLIAELTELLRVKG